MQLDEIVSDRLESSIWIADCKKLRKMENVSLSTLVFIIKLWLFL